MSYSDDDDMKINKCSFTLVKQSLDRTRPNMSAASSSAQINLMLRGKILTISS
jgi:hypothetical protein